jgi:protein AATF/BFR2
MLTSYLDFDPEDIENGGQSSDDEDVEKPDENAGREHYQAVG